MAILNEVVLLGTENSSFACTAELFHAITSHVPSSLSPARSVMSLCDAPSLAVLAGISSLFPSLYFSLGSTHCGWWAICRIPFLSNVGVGVWHWIREEQRGEWNVQRNWRGLLGVSVHFSVVIAYDWFPLLVVIQWWGVLLFPILSDLYNLLRVKVSTTFFSIECLSPYKWKTQFQENPLKFCRDKTVLSRCVYVCVCLCKHTSSHKHNLLSGSAPTMQNTNLKGL